MILKNVTITCYYRQVKEETTTLAKALRIAYNLAKANKVKAGVTAHDENGNAVVKVIDPDGKIIDYVNGVETEYRKLNENEREHGHRRTT